MNSKTKTILYIVIFAVFMAGSVMLYNYLSERNKAGKPDNLATLTPSPSPEETDEGRNQAGSDDTDSPEGDENQPLKAIDFTAYDYDGNKVSLFDYIGTPLVVNFWASWCGPCRDEMPHFNKVSQEYSEDELIFLMVDLVDGQRETVDKGKKFVEDNNYTFKVLFDKDQDAAYTYSIRSIPCTLFIDSEGYVQAGLEGSMNEETLRRGIEIILD